MKEAEQRLRHKLFPLNAWMKVADINVLTSCPKDELHPWLIGIEGENKVKHPIVSNEAVARVFRRLADRLQGVVAGTYMMTISPY